MWANFNVIYKAHHNRAIMVDLKRYSVMTDVHLILCLAFLLSLSKDTITVLWVRYLMGFISFIPQKFKPEWSNIFYRWILRYRACLSLCFVLRIKNGCLWAAANCEISAITLQILNVTAIAKIQTVSTFLCHIRCLQQQQSQLSSLVNVCQLFQCSVKLRLVVLITQPSTPNQRCRGLF